MTSPAQAALDASFEAFGELASYAPPGTATAVAVRVMRAAAPGEQALGAGVPGPWAGYALPGERRSQPLAVTLLAAELAAAGVPRPERGGVLTFADSGLAYDVDEPEPQGARALKWLLPLRPQQVP